MKIDAAKDLLETVFASSYSRDNFKRLAAEVFNRYDRKEQTIYEEGIKNFTNLGLYGDDEAKKIAVFEVELLSENSLHHARVKQRNLIANQLKIHDYDSALCSFYHPNQGEWRLSFVTRESSIDVSAEKLKFIEQLSPSRRQSFIAGPNEGTHTAKKQFLLRIQSDNNPSFDEIASIFEIEAVNDDFYEQYKELYLRLTEELEQFMEKDPVIAADFKEKEVSASDFAKKTLGQFVFLYFLQRKGWIKDKALPDDRFSFSKLFDNRKNFGENFFNDLMEPIFYESLAKKEPNLEVYSVLRRYEFPYLNGGLFEPIRDYDWEKTNIVISDTFFKNDNRTKDGDHGDGLLDVFNRFNFTVHENDALDQDIAVDPEMLGKVFENLLDIKDRKSKGAFYTPREIVQYMCQESLINYLVTEIGDEIPSEFLKLFITNHSILEAKDMKGTELEFVADNAMALDQLLANVKVCDPAVGSGAFPMGMLSEIVGARNSLQPFLSNKRTIYDLKLHTIGQSLYGVDLDPSAVDIARLRFWLSLIIEEDIPTPLPNLEHKLMQGNSLLSSYEGIELFNDQLLANEDSRQEKLTIIDEEVKVLEKELKDGVNTTEIPRIQAIKKHLIRLGKQKIKIQAEHTTTTTTSTQQLFENDDALSKIRKKVDLLQSKISQFLLPEGNSNKEALKNDIEDIKWDLIEASVDSESKARSFEQLKNKRIQPFFLWKLEFADVFANKNGFDIVIGNPPYLRVQGIEKDLSEEYKKIYRAATGKFDLYVLFVEKSLELLGPEGIVNFIMPHKWINSSFGKGLRELTRNKIEKLISFESFQIFNAMTYTSLVWFSSKTTDIVKYTGLNKALKTKNNLEMYLFNLTEDNYTHIGTDKLSKDAWIFTDNVSDKVLTKIMQQPLRASDVFEYIYQGTVTTGDSIFYLKGKIDGNIFIGYSDALNSEVRIEKSIMKPILLGGTVKRYCQLDNENKYVLYPHFLDEKNNTKPFEELDLKNQFPLAYKYLLTFKEELLGKKIKYKTNPKYWYGLHCARKITVFETEKIITPEISKNCNMSLDNANLYTNTKNYILIKKNSTRESYKYFLAILNSKLMWFFIKNTGYVLAGGFYTFKTDYLKPFPLPGFALPEIIIKLESLVDQVMDGKKNNLDTISLEKEIDKLIYQLYGLTDDEIAVVEKSNTLMTD